MLDLSHICDLPHSSQQRKILNPLSEARDRTSIFMDANRIIFCCATIGTPYFILFFSFRPHQWYMKFLGQGLNLNHSCDSCRNLPQHQILNPLITVGTPCLTLFLLLPKREGRMSWRPQVAQKSIIEKGNGKSKKSHGIMGQREISHCYVLLNIDNCPIVFISSFLEVQHTCVLKTDNNLPTKFKYLKKDNYCIKEYKETCNYC